MKPGLSMVAPRVFSIITEIPEALCCGAKTHCAKTFKGTIGLEGIGDLQWVRQFTRVVTTKPPLCVPVKGDPRICATKFLLLQPLVETSSLAKISPIINVIGLATCFSAPALWLPFDSL
jgi:hypothetical protein